MSRSTRRRISVGISPSFVSYLARTGSQSASVASVGAHSLDVDRVELRAVDAIDLDDGSLQRAEVPILRIGFLAGVAVDGALEQLLGERQQVLAPVDHLVFGDVDLALEQLAAQRVDALALLVHHVVVFEEVLADGEVLRLDLLLRRSMALVTILCSIGTPSSMPSRCIRPEMRPNRRCASGRLRATGRSATSPDRPGGRRGRAAGCRCAALRAARWR